MAKLPKQELSERQYASPEEFLGLFPGHKVFCYLQGDKLTAIDGTYDTLKVELAAKNHSSSIYFTMSETNNGNRRRKIDYVKTRAVGIDDDGISMNGGYTDPNKFPIPPNVIIHTSPGKYQYLWLTEQYSHKQHEAVCRRMAEDFNGDPSFADCTRVCRMPGFRNVKYDISEPVKVEILSREPYSWDVITEHFPPLEKEAKDIAGRVNPKHSLDLHKASLEIIAGEVLHDNLLRMSANMAKRGYAAKDIYSLMKTLLMLAEPNVADKTRITRETEKLQDTVDSGVARFASKKVAFERDGEDSCRYTILDWPPGFVGKLSHRFYNSMRSPSREIAIAAAMHTVSVLGCGCYHYNGVTVTRRRLILAATGRGKQTLSNCFYSIIRSLNIPGLLEEFIAEDANSALNLQIDFNKHKLRSVITTERGIGGQSKAGDKAGKHRLIIDALSMKVGGAPLTMPAISKRSNMTHEHGPVYDPILVLLEESTPETFVKEFNESDADHTGDLARSEVFFIELEDIKNGPNFDHYKYTSPTEEEIEKFQALVVQYKSSDCMDGTQPGNSDKHILVDFSQVEHAMRDYEISRYHLRLEEGIVRSQVTREMERIQSTCIILATADSVDINRENPKPPIVTMEHYEYAIKYHNEIDRALAAAMRGGALADTMSQIQEILYHHLAELASSPQPDPFTKDGNITPNWISRKFRPNNRHLKELQRLYKRSRKELIRMVLETAEVDGMITPIPGKFEQWTNNVG